MTYADSGLVVGYTYNNSDLTEIRENPSGSNTSLAVYAYDDRGRRTSLTRGNGQVTTYSYDAVDRLTQVVHDLSGSTYDVTLGDSYDPAGGIVSHTSSNDNYAWTNHYAINRGYTANGLNQYSAAGSITPTYDTRGNVTSAGNTTYGYSAENMLTSATGSITLGYDPLGRLYQTVGAATTRLGYDGGNVIAEYNSSNVLQRRYVFGPGTDEPLVWYEGTGTSTRRYYHADERGSVVATSDGSGVMANINTYDEYGIPGSSNTGRFQYTGQQWLSDLGMYHYRARAYSPTLGRFMQTDPIGFGGGINIYAYALNDPMNRRDPLGLDPPPPGGPPVDEEQEVTVNGRRVRRQCSHALIQIGHICVAPSDFSSLVIGQTTFTFVVRAPPTIALDVDCTAIGSIVTCARVAPPPPDACGQVGSESGSIFAVSFGGNVSPVRGLTGSVGYFTNLRTGSEGFYHSTGFTTALGAEVGLNFHYFGSMRNFVGTNENFYGGSTPVQLNLAFSPQFDDFVGGSIGPTFGETAGYTHTNTVLFSCTSGGG